MDTRKIVLNLIFALATVLIPTSSWALTYYVSTTGDDSRSCSSAQSVATPKRTIASGASCLVAGDTLFLRGGTYLQAMPAVPSGTSWSTPVTIASYPGETAILRPGQGRTVIDVGSRYVVFENLVADGLAGHYGIHVRGSYLRFKNVEVKNATYSGIIANRAAAFNEFINMNIHDNGQCLPLPDCTDETGYGGHGIYNESSNTLFEGNHIHHNYGYGLHIYSGWADRVSNNVIRGNRFYSNYGKGSGGNGMIASTGDNNLIYNNVFYTDQAVGYAIIIQYNNVTNTKVYNNTIYGHPSGGIYIGATATGTIVRNNIVFGNGDSIINYGVSTSLSHNMTTDPRFVNAAARDFRLQSSSPAIDIGATLSEVPRNIVGVSRPQGAGYDIGAYESSSTGATPVPTPPPTPVPTPVPSPTPSPSPTPIPSVTPSPAPTDNIAPTVTIISPANGSTVLRKSTLQVQVQASDNVGVREVRFFVNGSLTCSDTTAPYTCSWRVPAQGGRQHLIEVQAFDANGNMGRQSIIVSAQ